MPTESSSPTRRDSVVAVVVAAAGALAAGELAAGLVQKWQSPVVAVAGAVIDLSPPAITKFGIAVFGTNDKLALVIGILVLLAGLAVGVGIAARRRQSVALAAFGALAVVGLLASVRSGGLTTGVPSVFAGLAGAGLVALLFPQRPFAAAQEKDPASAEAPTTSRRAFLVLSGSALAVAAVAGAGGRYLAGRFSAVASRMAVMLPKAAKPLPAASPALGVDVEGMTPFFTPNNDFYRIDTALTVPQVPAETWKLRVHGMVEDEYEITFDELMNEDLIEVDITLSCVSNQVGGELVGNARWLGIRLRELLDRAGVDKAADQIVGRSADGYTCGFPLSAAYDRDAIVAVGMNGEPLPLQHGFPARLVTPGLYGYVSATKWLTEIELTTFDSFDQYWVPRGYAQKAPIKTMSRVDVPRTGQIIEPGPTVVAGVAWAQTRGISKVEVKFDDGEFEEAELAKERTADTWRQWRHPWNAPEGTHRITVRATDGEGELQTEARTEPLPDGATGWQSRIVVVRAAA